MKSRLSVLALCAAMLSACEVAYAYDSVKSLNQPANALVAPFDNTEGNQSFLIVSNVGGVSPAGPQVTTHWAFWADNCAHLGDVSLCLTLDDTVVVDTTVVQAIAKDNTPIGPQVSLAGHRGFVTITAFTTDEDCSDARNGGTLVDDALTGTFTLANIPTGSAYSGEPARFGVACDLEGCFTDTPDVIIDSVEINTFAPESLARSQGVVIALQERTGEDTGFPGEIGPANGEVSANVSFFDNLEVRASMPDLKFSHSIAINALEEARGGFFPLIGATSGFFQFRNISITNDFVTLPVGNSTTVVGVLGQSLGSFGIVQRPVYSFTDQ